MLLIMIQDQYPNNYKTLQIYTGYFDSLDIMTLFSYPSSIVIITRDYYMLLQFELYPYSFLPFKLMTTGCIFHSAVYN